MDVLIAAFARYTSGIVIDLAQTSGWATSCFLSSSKSRPHRVQVQFTLFLLILGFEYLDFFGSAANVAS